MGAAIRSIILTSSQNLPPISTFLKIFLSMTDRTPRCVHSILLRKPCITNTPTPLFRTQQIRGKKKLADHDGTPAILLTLLTWRCAKKKKTEALRVQYRNTALKK
jgi:hypothetical protein